MWNTNSVTFDSSDNAFTKTFFLARADIAPAIFLLVLPHTSLRIFLTGSVIANNAYRRY
jgi:hypothetical protein